MSWTGEVFNTERVRRVVVMRADKPEEIGVEFGEGDGVFDWRDA
jgi:hypothetical protein